MEHENNYTSRGQGALNTVLGAIGTAGVTGVLGNVGGIFGGGRGACEHYVSRREADMAAEIAELKSEKMTDGKILELYKYIDGKFAGVEAQLCQQAVVNTQTVSALSCLTNTVNTLSGLTKTIIPIANICPTPAVATTT